MKYVFLIALKVLGFLLEGQPKDSSKCYVERERKMKSPEDHPSWGRNLGDGHAQPACSKCKNTIVLWHCADTGCPWCAQCVLKTKSIDQNE